MVQPTKFLDRGPYSLQYYWTNMNTSCGVDNPTQEPSLYQIQNKYGTLFMPIDAVYSIEFIISMQRTTGTRHPLYYYSPKDDLSQ